MTRKRFIKLLMANGAQRNKANKIANLYNARKIPYSRAYPIAALSQRIAKTAKTLNKFSINIAKSINAFSNLKRSFNNATQQTYTESANT